MPMARRVWQRSSWKWAADMRKLGDGLHVHLVGIGGAGLSAIARILLERGCRVSGSDMTASKLTAALAAEGAQIFAGHSASHVEGADLLLATSAADDDHVELAAARRMGIAVYRRRDFMPILLHDRHTIAVAGTHGKTTTTSMLIHALQSAGQAPGFIVGGAMGRGGRNASAGADRTFVIEADEYGNMFLGLSPSIAVITNIEHDHPDFFASQADMLEAFRQFAASIRPGGLLVVCADDEMALEIAQEHQARGGMTSSYAINKADADWQAGDIRLGHRSRFMAWRAGVALGELSLTVPGQHNIANALAAMAVAHALDVPFASMASALASFQPTARRFEVRGSRDGVIVVDDYAHHPTAIKANIAAARARYPRHAIWVVWQPHTYSRVQQFWADFTAAFQGADRVLITPIYAAREAPLARINAERLAAATPRASFTPSFAHAVRRLRQSLTGPAVLLIFSAGDANTIAELYLNAEADSA